MLQLGAAAKPQVPGCGGMRACLRVLPIWLRLYANAGNGRFLRGYDGNLQGDAYRGHDATAKREDVIEVGRWDHARRYFFNGSDEDSSVGAQLLAHIKRLLHHRGHGEHGGSGGLAFFGPTRCSLCSLW